MPCRHLSAKTYPISPSIRPSALAMSELYMILSRNTYPNNRESIAELLDTVCTKAEPHNRQCGNF